MACSQTTLEVIHLVSAVCKPSRHQWLATAGALQRAWLSSQKMVDLGPAVSPDGGPEIGSLESLGYQGAGAWSPQHRARGLFPIT